MSIPASTRIAYIIKMFPRFSETFILSEVLELERSGVEVHIFSLKAPNDQRRHADVESVRGPVTYVPENRRRAALGYFRRHAEVLSWNPARYLRTASHVAKRRRWGAFKRFLQAGYIAPELRRQGITHVHAHFASSATSVSYYLNQLMGMGYSFTAHAKDIYIDTVANDVLVRKMRNARFVVTVSDYNLRHLAALEPGVAITRIYNGLDLEQFSPNGTRPDSRPLVLGVGRLVEKKGFDDLVRACAILRDTGVEFSCQIVGTGSEERKLRALIDELHLHGCVELTGPMPREELLRLYPRASVFIAPSVIGRDGNRDGLPTVLIEAMALGVPVISTPVTGIPELVRHEETGLLVEPANPEALSRTIARSLADRERALSMARNGRELVERQFDLHSNVALLRNLFEQAS